ncbi:alpha/beta-hydrolase [Aspergillus eucalypticola CBS 122712]|uniref:Alpha/beta-hydrolase n=1 Tax=Aspergillus eucalypticola (strain CBS 122712 / IBT 29274) TaxID=1448314 RepID=A0A317V6V0_ASPEC|nr:alpha/beta-hydrolase [Aspergillus eucalypticola CBS 122712]PWY67870.1 alpha/beta-hydrolase [Aspergillus eucalypticola CBS 122712]
MEPILHIQGDAHSSLAPLIFIHAVSGLAWPYMALGNLSNTSDPARSRPVYGISSPVYSLELRPHGPYLLGGWSMGGMIAVKMAEILQAEKETVQQVILLDSINPEKYPAFVNEEEHRIIADGLFTNVCQAMGMADLADNSDDVDNRSDASEASDDGSTMSDEEEDDNLHRLFSTMRRHIHASTLSIASTEPGKLLPPNSVCHTSVTLVKCTELSETVPALFSARQRCIRRCALHPTLQWRPQNFDRFRTLLIDARHDSLFDEEHVEEVTSMLRQILESC